MNRKFTALFVLCAVAVMSLASGAGASYWDEGNNGMTEANAYIIDSLEDLTDLRDRVNAGTEPSDRYYKLTQNITTEVLWYDHTIGEDATKPFTGHFNGNGNTISISRWSSLFGVIDSDGTAVKYLNVSGNIDKDSTSDGHHHVAGGIAGILKSGTIENCNFNGKVSLIYNFGYTTGGIAGIINSGGKVVNCRVSGDVTAGSNYSYEDRFGYAGGIAGRLEGGTIEKCRVTINDSVYAFSNNSGGQDVNKSRAGGIVGDVSGSTSKITNCVVKGTVRSKEWSGGIVGYMQGGSLTNCYVLGDSSVEGNYSAGGIAGYLGGDAIADSNWIVLDSQVSAVEYSVGGVVGYLNSGTVTNNRAYTRILGRAQYKGSIIGYAQGSPNTWSGNYYNSDGGATYTIGYNNSIRAGSSEGGSSHAAESTTMIDPVDPDPLNPSPFVTPTPTPTTITITTASLPSGTVNTAYNQALAANVSGVSWSLASGSLPNGLTLSSAGVISGTPTTAGSFTFSVTATNGTNSASKQFTIAITGAPDPTPTPTVTITITKSSLAGGTVGSSYNDALTANTSGVTWAVTSGALPAGLTLNASTGSITGTPTTAGTSTFTITASMTGAASASREYTITIAERPTPSGTISIMNSELYAATVGISYRAELYATTSDSSSVTWSVSSGSLPAGLSLSASTGVIYGTPSRSGTFTFTVTASSGSASASKSFTIEVDSNSSSDSNNNGFSILTTMLSDGTVGTPYSDTLRANVNGVRWRVSNGVLPDGLQLSSTSGTISGTPRTAGTNTIEITAEYGQESIRTTFTIVINASGALTITTSSLPNATVNTEYRANILANMSSVSWGIEGALPPGLDFNTSTGQIAGVPTSTGTYNFTITAAGNSQSTSKVFTIIVSAAPQQENNNNNNNDDSGGGGGCNALSGMSSLILCAGLFVLRLRKR